MQFVCWRQAQGEFNRLLAHLPELSPSTLKQRSELDAAKNKQPLRLVLQALKGGNESPQEDMPFAMLDIEGTPPVQHVFCCNMNCRVGPCA